MNIFDLQAKISLDASQFNAGIEQARGSMETVGGGISAGAVAMGNLVAGAATKAASDLVDFGKSAVDTGMNFDAAMSNVKAISGATGEEFDALRDKAKQMGASTAFTATEAAEAFSYMAMAGWKTGDMLDGIEGIMNLAAASGESLASTSDIVTDALTAFGLSAEDSGHFADVLAAASSNANTNVGMMGDTFKYVAPVAGALGFSIEDTAQAIGLMANAGIKSSQAGTALRSILTRLAKPTKESSMAMDILGVSLDDADGNMKSFGEVMDDIRKGFEGKLKISTEDYAKEVEKLNAQFESKAITKSDYESALEMLDTRLNGSSESVQAMMAAMLGGQEAMSGLLAIVNASDADFAKLSGSISTASEAAEGQGVAFEMAQTQLDNLNGKVTIFQSAMDGLKTAIYDRFSAPMSEAVATATDGISRITEGLESGGIKGALEGLGSLISEKFSGISDAVGQAIQPVKDFFAVFDEASGGAISTFAGAAKDLFDAFVSASATTIDAIAQGIRNFVGAFDSDTVAGVIGNIARGAADLFDAFAKVQGDVVTDVSNAIKVFVDGFDNEGAASAIQNIATKASELFKAFSGAVADRIKSISEKFSGFATRIAELATEFPVDFKKIGDAVSGFIEIAKDIGVKFEEFTRPIRDFFGTVLSTLIQGAVGIVVGAAGGIINAFADIVNFINNSLGAAIALLSGDFEGAAEKVKAAWGSIVDFFKDIWQGIKGAFAGAKDAFGDIGRNLVEGLKEGVLGAWNSFTGWLSDKVSGLINGVKNLFGEHSPSKVFADIGANLVLGMGQGWSSEWGDLERTVGNDVSGLVGTAKIGFGDSAIGRSSAAGITSMLTAGAGASSQPVQVNLVLDGDVAAKVLYDPLRRVAWQKDAKEAAAYA